MTSLENKVSILADLWINYRDEKAFEDFFDYNDMGLPLAYFIHTEISDMNEKAEVLIEETFNLLCAALNLDLEGEYESLSEMLDAE